MHPTTDSTSLLRYAIISLASISAERSNLPGVARGEIGGNHFLFVEQEHNRNDNRENLAMQAVRRARKECHRLHFLQCPIVLAFMTA